MQTPSCTVLCSGCLLALAVASLCSVVPAVAQLRVEPAPPNQGPDACLHAANESAAEASRREEALRAMQLIYYAVARSPGRPLPTWETLGESAAVDGLRQADTPAGALARKMQWGAPEPLPGWRIAYRASALEVRFDLTDSRDPCRFRYSSSDPRVVLPLPGRIVPLDS